MQCKVDEREAVEEGIERVNKGIEKGNRKRESKKRKEKKRRIERLDKREKRCNVEESVRCLELWWVVSSCKVKLVAKLSANI